MNYLEEYKKIFNNEKFIRHGKKITLKDHSEFNGRDTLLFFDSILEEIRNKKTVSLLDYYCGTSLIWHDHPIGRERKTLFEILSPNIQSFYRFDIRNDLYSIRPSSKFDIIFCTNGLEQFSKNDLDKVLKELKEFSKESTHIFCTVNTVPSKNFFLNGNNMSITQEPAEFWIDTLKNFNFCKISLMIDKNKLVNF